MGTSVASNLTADALHLLQIIYPFIDEVTRSKAEFVNTKDFHAPSKSAATSTWSSWASSMFHTKSSTSSKFNGVTAAPAGADDDAAMVVQEGSCGAKITTKGPEGSTFQPLLWMYERPYSLERQQELLSGCGWQC